MLHDGHRMVPATRRRPRARTKAIFLTGVFAAAQVIAGPPVEITGRIEPVPPNGLLRVWGTPEEMGFAHGYLRAREIVSDVQAMIGMFYGQELPRYDRDLLRLKGILDVPREAMAEIEGIYRGVVTFHDSPPLLPLLNRPLGVDDLVFYNSYDAVRAFGCSGFTVWGDRAKGSWAITARNFDFPIANRTLLEHQMILVRQGLSTRQVATVTWPGYIGVFTGFNEDGVAVFLHDGSGPRTPEPTTRYTPLALAMKEVLENCRCPDAVSLTRKKLSDIHTPFSYLVRVVTRRERVPDHHPETVFRIDPTGVSENPEGTDRCITTNHYLNAEFNPPAGAKEDSVQRYATLQSATDRPVTAADAWAALGAVAVGKHAFGTLHSLVYFPQERRLQLAFARWGEPIVSATEAGPPVAVDFEKLFGAQD